MSMAGNILAEIEVPSDVTVGDLQEMDWPAIRFLWAAGGASETLLRDCKAIQWANVLCEA